MKAISLWQPWASLWLVTPRIKLDETRHWHVSKQWPEWKPGERMAVHAAQRFEKDHDVELASILRRVFGDRWFATLPTGALLGTIALTACEPTEKVVPPIREMPTQEWTDNLECGDFTPGRFAWRGADPIVFRKPVPGRGHQGIFNVPDEIIAQAMKEAA